MSKNTIENGTKARQLDMHEINLMISNIGLGKTKGVAEFVSTIGKAEMTPMQLSFIIGDIGTYYTRPKHIDSLPRSDRINAVNTNMAVCKILDKIISSQDLSPGHASKILKLGNTDLNVSIVSHNWGKLTKLQRRNLEKRANPDMLDAIRKNHTDGSPL